MIAELAEYTEDQFVEAFADMSVADFLDMIQRECGIEAKRHPRKVDTIKGAYEAIKAAAAGEAPAADPSPSVPPGTDPEPSAGASVPAEDQVFEVRSRQPQGRWRAGRAWGKAYERVAESSLRPEEWEALRADPQIDIRKPR